MKRKLKAIISLVLCLTVVFSSGWCLGAVSAADATVEYYMDGGKKTGIKSVTTGDGTVYYDIADGGMLADSAGSVPEFYIQALTSKYNGVSSAEMWANVASLVFEDAGNFVGFNDGLTDVNGDLFDTLFTQDSTSNGDFNLIDALSSESDFTSGTVNSILDDYAHVEGLAYYSDLNSVQKKMASELISAMNNTSQTQADIFKGATGAEDGFELLRDTTQKPVIAAIATNRATDPSDPLSTGVFSYSSFGLAFYDFELVPFAPEGVEFVTAAEGYDSLEDASANNAPGVEYNNSSSGSAFTSYTSNPTISSADVSVSFSETNSISLSNSMQSTESYTYGTDAGISSKISGSIPELFGFEIGASLNVSTQETIATAYESGKTVTQETTTSSTAQVTLPAHTKIGITQQSSEIETALDYSCPVYIKYKVAIFAMNGYGSLSQISSNSLGGMCTVFGSASSVNGISASDNLYKRAVQYLDMPSFESSQISFRYSSHLSDYTPEPIDWKAIIDVKQNNGDKTLRECAEWLYGNVPLSAAGAKISMTVEGMSTNITGIEPLYNLDNVRVEGTGTYNLAIGGSLDLATVITQGYNQYNVPYYGYVTMNGGWEVCDVQGNPLTSVDGILLEDVSNYQILTAVAIGDYYLKYTIDENVYKDANNSNAYITNDKLTSLPIIKICVTKTGENHNCTPGEWKTTIPATCFMDGEQIQCCSVCGLQMNVRKLDKLAHTAVKITTPATCHTAGSQVEFCGICNSVISSEEIELLEHTLGEWVISPATCTEDGLKQQSCTVCHALVNSEVIPATGHDDGVWKIDFEATLDHDGQKTRYCTKCNQALESTSIEKHKHTFGYEQVVTPATCTVDGIIGKYCAECNVCYEAEAIPAKGHGEKIGTITVQPTCTFDGQKTFYCADCGMQTGVEAVKALGHDDGVWKIDFEATADHGGQMTRYCSVCNVALESKTFELHEHSYSSWKTNNDGTHSRDCYKCGFTESANCKYVATKTDATCTQGGHTTYVCSDCNHTYVDDYTEALDHSWSEWKDCADGCCHERACLREGCDETETQEHSWGEWVYNKDGKIFKNGTETRMCDDCGASETQEAEHTSTISRIFYPVIVFFGNIVHKIIYIISLNWLFPELTITP